MSAGFETSVELHSPTGAVGDDLPFTATITLTASADSTSFTTEASGIAEVQADAPQEIQKGVPVQVDGTLRATSDGSGIARIRVDRTGESPSGAAIVIYVEADRGVVAVGDSSESATRRALADELLRTGAINAEEHAERLADIAGG